jgi:hypothetical protein
VENEEYELQDVEFDLSSEDVELDAVGDELDDAGNECQCVRAVKIKDGGPNCLICGLNAYNSQYSFSHTPGGIALLAAHQGAQRPAPVDLAAPLLASVPEPPRMAAEPKKIKVPKPPKPPKPAKAKKKEKTVNPLFEAVKFIALAQKSKGDEMTTHCMIAYGGITAFDRTIACGVVIKEDELNCIPNTELLLQALSHCGPEYTIVQLPESLHIASGDFAAYVPCTTADKMVTAVPDPSVAPLSDEFREAIKIVGALVKDTGTTLLQAAIQLNPYTVIATNGQVIMEAFHGHDMPPTKMLVPKGFADRLNKTKKVIKSFGFTAETFTVHFEDRSWMRTNLYKGAMEYDIHAAINIEAINKHPIPGNFFEAADEVAKWSKDGRVFLYDSRVSSHDRESQTVGSCRTFAMDGFANNRIYSIAALKTISKVALSMDDTSSRNLALFFGTKVRGALKYDVMRDPPPPIGSVEWTYCDACQQHSHHNPSHQCRNPACAKFGVINPQDDDIPF